MRRLRSTVDPSLLLSLPPDLMQQVILAGTPTSALQLSASCSAVRPISCDGELWRSFVPSELRVRLNHIALPPGAWQNTLALAARLFFRLRAAVAVGLIEEPPDCLSINHIRGFGDIPPIDWLDVSNDRLRGRHSLLDNGRVEIDVASLPASVRLTLRLGESDSYEHYVYLRRTDTYELYAWNVGGGDYTVELSPVCRGEPQSWIVTAPNGKPVPHRLVQPARPKFGMHAMRGSTQRHAPFAGAPASELWLGVYVFHNPTSHEISRVELLEEPPSPTTERRAAEGSPSTADTGRRTRAGPGAAASSRPIT